MDTKIINNKNQSDMIRTALTKFLQSSPSETPYLRGFSRKAESCLRNKEGRYTFIQRDSDLFWVFYSDKIRTNIHVCVVCSQTT